MMNIMHSTTHEAIERRIIIPPGKIANLATLMTARIKMRAGV
jgi:hypothetical protein